MTPLRQRMTEDMQLRGLAPATQQAYLRYVEQLAVFTGKSPDLATDEDFRQFFLALHKQRGCSRSTATVAIAAFKFLFEMTLQRPWPRLDLFRPRPTQTLPVILSVDEVWRILSQLEQPTYYTCLATIVHLRLAHQRRHQPPGQLDRQRAHAAASARWEGLQGSLHSAARAHAHP